MARGISSVVVLTFLHDQVLVHRCRNEYRTSNDCWCAREEWEANLFVSIGRGRKLRFFDVWPNDEEDEFWNNPS